MKYSRDVRTACLRMDHCRVSEPLWYHPRYQALTFSWRNCLGFGQETLLNKTCNIEAEEDWWGWWFGFFEIFRSVLLALTPDCNVENGVFLQSAIFPLPQNFASFVWTDVTICLQNGPSTNGIKNRNFKPIHTSMILHIHERVVFLTGPPDFQYWGSGGLVKKTTLYIPSWLLWYNSLPN